MKHEFINKMNNKYPEIDIQYSLDMYGEDIADMWITVTLTELTNGLSVDKLSLIQETNCSIHLINNLNSNI